MIDRLPEELWMEVHDIVQEAVIKTISKKKKFKKTREYSIYGHHQMVNTEIRLVTFFAAKDREPLYSQQKQDWELTVAQIMNSLLPNSDLN